ncbi:MAG TPA: VOC family protein [Flavitalea sp.]|nr:VOC family protein [Flavitalea sp.]
MAIKTQGMAPLFQVFDMPTSISFYRDKIGFQVIDPTHDDVDWALLRFNDVELMLNTAYEKHDRPSVRDASRIAAHADTSIYFGCPDVDAAYFFLSEKGVILDKPVITSYGWKAIYVYDPDNYCLCFHWPYNR